MTKHFTKLVFYFAEKKITTIAVLISHVFDFFHSPLLSLQHPDHTQHQPRRWGHLPVHCREQCGFHSGQRTPHCAVGWWTSWCSHPCPSWRPLTHHHPGFLERAGAEHSGHHWIRASHPQNLRWNWATHYLKVESGDCLHIWIINSHLVMKTWCCTERMLMSLTPPTATVFFVNAISAAALLTCFFLGSKVVNVAWSSI